MKILLFFGIIALANCNNIIRPSFEKVVNLDNYDRYTSPAAFIDEGGPIRVKVGMFVDRMRNFCEKNKEFQIDLYLRQNWTDPRLAHNSSKPYKFREEYLQKIWIPDTFFPWDHSGRMGPLALPNVMIKINSNGSVMYSAK